MGEFSQSAQLGISLPHLCRHFKEHTGKTVATYINEVKIDEVKRLLAAGEGSVLEISVRLGFSSAKYMAAVFRRVVGVGIGEWRKSGRL
ncbi:MAG: AraC family transcriptional regulator [Defluviitaleaceae bacterium]|nr:AraC family transcriptional regulator [Defluviitaleaceae bacterium]